MTERTLGPRLPELRALALDVALRARMKRKAPRAISDESLRRSARDLREANAGQRTPPFVRVEHAPLGGRPAEWVHVGGESRDAVILYFHGGGFFMSSPAEHRPLTWRLARATSRRVVSIDYRKAPDHAFPAWLDDAFAAYSELLARGHDPADIVVAGDSAGGNIALALGHRLRREGGPMPGKMVLFSPWADLLCMGRSFRANRRRDAMFDAHSVRDLGKWLTRGHDPAHPEISPAYGDFQGFPRMLVLAGSTEVFLDDARTVVKRARAGGVDAELVVYRHMPHVFPMFAGLVPRAKHAFELVKTFIEADAPAPRASMLRAKGVRAEASDAEDGDAGARVA